MEAGALPNACTAHLCMSPYCRSKLSSSCCSRCRLCCSSACFLWMWAVPNWQPCTGTSGPPPPPQLCPSSHPPSTSLMEAGREKGAVDAAHGVDVTASGVVAVLAGAESVGLEGARAGRGPPSKPRRGLEPTGEARIEEGAGEAAGWATARCVVFCCAVWARELCRCRGSHLTRKGVKGASSVKSRTALKGKEKCDRGRRERGGKGTQRGSVRA